MKIIIPGKEVTWYLISICNSELQKSNINFTIDLVLCREIIHACIEDILCRKMAWAGKCFNLDEVLSRFVSNGDYFLYEFMYPLISEYVYDRLSYLIDQNISCNTYEILEQSFMENGDICIESAGDYRIHEYYRLKETYEPTSE